MGFRVCLGLSALVLSLAACGGGGGGEAPVSDGGSSTPVVDPAPQAFSISGDWRAIGLAGIYAVSIDGGNGVIELTQPDEVSGTLQTLTLGGFSRGSDGAYIFQSGLAAGGLALDVALYRVDHDTMAGQILALRNGSMRRSPVILTRSWARHLNTMPGDWVSADVRCFYEQSKGRCESALGGGAFSAYQAGALSVRLSAAQFLVCHEAAPTSVSDCAPEKLQGVGVTDLGEGSFEFSGEQAFVFHAGGSDLIFGHGREGQADVLTYMELMARDAALAPTAWNGLWRIATHDGRIGTVTVTGDALTVEVDGRAPVTGTLRRNQPLRSIGLIELDGQTHPYYSVGNEKLVLVSGHEGYYLLHRE